MVRFAFILMVAVSSASGILSICLANGPSQSKQQALPPGAILRLGEAGKKAGAAQFRNLVFLQHKSLIVLGRQDGIRFYEFPSGRLKFMFSNKEIRNVFGITPDGRFLLVRTPATTGLGFFDVKKKDYVREIREPGAGFCEIITSGPNGKRIACAEFHRFVYLINSDSSKVHISQHHRGILDLAFSGDGRFLAVGDSSSLVHVWHTDTLRLHREFPVPGREIYKNRVRTGAVSLSFDGDLLAAGCYTGTFVWHVPSRKIILRAIGGYNKLSPDGRLLANINRLKGIELWEIATGKLITLIDPGKKVGLVVWSNDGRFLCSVANDYEVLVWDLTKLPGLESVQRSKKTAKNFATLWEDLKQGNPAVAYRAIRALTGRDEIAVENLSKQLKPAPAEESKVVVKLIDELATPNKERREKVAKSLADMGSDIQPLLEKAHAKHTSERVRIEAAELLRFLKRSSVTEEELRQIRAIQALQWIGGKESIELLQQLSGGDPVARRTQEAKLALEVIRTDLTAEPK